MEDGDGLADCLLPIASAFKDWSEILIDPGQARLLKNGAKLAYRFGKKSLGLVFMKVLMVLTRSS